MIRRPPRSTRTDTLFPYTTLFRSIVQLVQAGYDGYLYVDYYTVEGQVVHLYPNPGEPDSGRVLRGGERFNVGESARTWSVGPPFGQELITVISSPTPLYQGERPEFEEARVYLPALRGLLDAQAANPRLAANFLLLQTEPQEIGRAHA